MTSLAVQIIPERLAPAFAQSLFASIGMFALVMGSFIAWGFQ